MLQGERHNPSKSESMFLVLRAKRLSAAAPAKVAWEIYRSLTF